MRLFHARLDNISPCDKKGSIIFKKCFYIKFHTDPLNSENIIAQLTTSFDLSSPEHNLVVCPISKLEEIALKLNSDVELPQRIRKILPLLIQSVQIVARVFLEGDCITTLLHNIVYSAAVHIIFQMQKRLCVACLIEVEGFTSHSCNKFHWNLTNIKTVQLSSFELLKNVANIIANHLPGKTIAKDVLEKAIKKLLIKENRSVIYEHFCQYLQDKNFTGLVLENFSFIHKENS